MSARVLVLGLDAAEATLIEQWSARGLMPAFAGLVETGCVGRLDNCMHTLPGAIWPEITTGRSCGQLPLYFHPRQLRTGEARRRPIEAHELDPEDYYWAIASRAGHRVAVVDQPQTVEVPDFNGIQLREWGVHDRYFDRSAAPSGLITELEHKYGPHPVCDQQTGAVPIWSCDDHGETAEGYEALRLRLLAGVDNKTDVLLHLLQSQPWDLFVGSWTETHCAGHQFWHYLEGRGPGTLEQRALLENTMLDVYRRVDEGLGRVLRAAGPETWVLVFASHGMGPYIGGLHLLPEVLVRLGLASGGNSRLATVVRRLQGMVKRLPRRYHEGLRSLSRMAPVRAVQSVSGGLVDPLESPRTRAAALINNRCGAIRFNVAGREPYGTVEPGEELARLTGFLRRELLALEQPGTGERIITEVVTAEEAFGPDHHPDVPDLMIDFRQDLGLLESCQSAAVGTIEVSNYDPNHPRSGDHTPESRLWVRGPGLTGGGNFAANTLDIAPTVLRLLKVALPGQLDGRPLPEVQ